MDGCGSRSDSGNSPEPGLAEDEHRLRANLDQTHRHASAKSPSQRASVAVPHNDQHHVPLRRDGGKRLGRSAMGHARFSAQKFQRLGLQRRLRPGLLLFIERVPRGPVLRQRGR